MTPAPRRPIRFTPAAAWDMDEAFAYISAENRGAAAALLSRLRVAVERLAEFPEIGVALHAEDFELVTPGIRFLVVEPYLVFYRTVSDDVIILRILHSRRDSLDELLG